MTDVDTETVNLPALIASYTRSYGPHDERTLRARSALNRRQLAKEFSRRHLEPADRQALADELTAGRK